MAALHWVFIASFIWGFIALAGAFSACGKQKLLSGMYRSLITVAPLVAEHRLQARAPGMGSRHGLQARGFGSTAHELMRCGTQA